MDDYIKYGIIAGLVIGGLVMILFTTDMTSTHKRTPEEAQQTINNMMSEFMECDQKYGTVIGDDVSRCHNAVLAKYGQAP